MTDPAHPAPKPPDMLDWSKMMARVAEQSQRMVADFLARDGAKGTPDPFNIGGAFLELSRRMMADPAKLVDAQLALWNDYMALWRNATKRVMGEAADPVIAPAADDKRFRDQAWDQNVVFDFIKQSYLLSARWMQTNVRDVEGLAPRDAQKVAFYTRQFVDAMAPSNFVMTNPEVLRATVDSGGDNLLRGLDHLLDDLERGKGSLAIRMTDERAFELGRNIAVTPGKVVFQNELMQLIQYAPTTERVAARPLIIIPPWINKYYILDLRAQNSMVKWAVEQGLTVFMISWVNPDQRLAAKGFEDYMVEGAIAALDAARAITGEREANMVGYCLGGTLLAATLAYQAAQGEQRIASATFFATMVDFAEAGELSVFIDEEQLAALEDKMNRQGYLDGAAMATTFNMLRDNDLIWSFVVNNYLLGKEPFPFDLLYWNSDTTRMPAAMHSFYLRRMYQENKLVEPGGVVLNGVPIDLASITAPAFVVASKEDHIAPWRSCYRATQIYRGPTEFVLSASGHIAGIANHPAANKYCHWLNRATPAAADQWFETAERIEGSWWPRWAEWLGQHDGGDAVAARQPGAGPLPALEDAPGSYVMVKAA